MIFLKKKKHQSWYYEQIDLGFNYRMTDIQAALGLSQLDRIDEYVSHRSNISKWYDKQFEDTAIGSLVQKLDRHSSHHLYIVIIKDGQQERDKIYNKLIVNSYLNYLNKFFEN